MKNKVHGGKPDLDFKPLSLEFNFLTEETAVTRDSMMQKYTLETNFVE